MLIVFLDIVIKKGKIKNDTAYFSVSMHSGNPLEKTISNISHLLFAELCDYNEVKILLL